MREGRFLFSELRRHRSSFHKNSSRKEEKVSKSLKSFFLILTFFAATHSTYSSQKLTISEIAEKSMPCVVQILILDKTGEYVSSGTGFFIAPRKILTNEHVIDDAYSIKIILNDYYSDGPSYERVKILKSDMDIDLALLEIFGLRQPCLQFEEAQEIHPGQPVIAIGFPLGDKKKVSEGIVSTKKGYILRFGFTAPISSGSSGSPILNQKGCVIGIATSIAREGQNLNCGVALEAIKEFLNRPDNPIILEEAGSSVLFWVILSRVKNISLDILNFIFNVGKWMFFAVLKIISFLMFYLVLSLLLWAIMRFPQRFPRVFRTAVLAMITVILCAICFITGLIILDNADEKYLSNTIVLISVITLLGTLTYILTKTVWKTLKLKLMRLNPSTEKT